MNTTKAGHRLVRVNSPMAPSPSGAVSSLMALTLAGGAGAAAVTSAGAGEPVMRPVPVPSTPGALEPSPYVVWPTGEEVQGPGGGPVGGGSEIPKSYPHRLSVSGDYFHGEGHVSMPFNFSLSKVPGLENSGLQRKVAQPSRSSDYWGATLAYSYGMHWYLDVSYREGSSSGNENVPLGTNPDGSAIKFPSHFSIEDKWYQAFVRYELRPGETVQPYVKAGISYVTAELRDETVHPALGLYEQTTDTEDILGHLGVGVLWRVKAKGRLQVGLQLEAEGFYGVRQQDSLEMLPEIGPFPQWQDARIYNTLYGMVGRWTVKVDYHLDRKERLFAFANVGFQANYTIVDYDDLGDFDELLWGPYVKLGLLYKF